MIDRELNIGDIKVKNALTLAPMEGVTDLPFRAICRRMGADIVYTEFVASEALIRVGRRSSEKMQIIDEERPCSIQIFGGSVKAMVESAKIVVDRGADFVDINAGCWVGKIVNKHAGAALLRDLDLLEEMTAAIVLAVDKPVTVKTRIGWDPDTINILETAQRIERAGAEALTIHCRTRSMGHSGSADWSWINQVKELVKIPIIVNGGIESPEDALRAFQTTNCDGVMIGRSAIGNPFIFKQAREMINTGVAPAVLTIEERIVTCLEHLKLCIEYKGGKRGLMEFRKHYAGYLKGYYNVSQTRQELVRLETYEEIETCLYRYAESLKKHYELQEALERIEQLPMEFA